MVLSGVFSGVLSAEIRSMFDRGERRSGAWRGLATNTQRCSTSSRSRFSSSRARPALCVRVVTGLPVALELLLVRSSRVYEAYAEARALQEAYADCSRWTRAWVRELPLSVTWRNKSSKIALHGSTPSSTPSSSAPPTCLGVHATGRGRQGPRSTAKHGRRRSRTSWGAAHPCAPLR